MTDFSSRSVEKRRPAPEARTNAQLPFAQAAWPVWRAARTGGAR